MSDGSSGPELGNFVELIKGKFDASRIVHGVQELAQSARERDLKGVLQNKLAGPAIQEKANLIKGKTNELMRKRAETPLGKKIYEELARHELTQGITPDTVVDKYNLGIEELSKLMETVTRIPRPILETLFHGAHLTELFLNREVMWRESWEPRIDSIRNLAARAKTKIK